MLEAEINALMRAHKSRAAPVVFLPILRQPELEATSARKASLEGVVAAAHALADTSA
jgi:hypothetical protein